MIFGNAEMMGVPWETIIKQYRSHLGKKSFPTVSDYTTDFLEYLAAAKPHFSDEQQREHFFVSCLQFFGKIHGHIVEQLNIKKDGSEASKKTPTEMAIDICNSVSRHKILGCVDEHFQDQLRGAYAPETEKACAIALENFEFSPDLIQKLRHVAVHYLTSSSNLDSRSGLVFAGFGESQIFPAVRTVSPHLISLNRLLYAEETGLCHEVSFKSESCVVPFAQSDVVATFLEGIKPSHKKLYESSISTVFDGLPEFISSKLADIEEGKRLAIVEGIRNNLTDGKKELFDEVAKEIQIKEITPLLDVVAVLPKDELAALAEALVNLTSVKRKMSHGQETVGGPIDVAVISKGDGFIWISRKHYFKPELNVHFTRTYFER